MDHDKFNTNKKTQPGGQRDPNEGTILTQIEEERTEETMGQQKLMDMFSDLQLPEYQGLQSESKKTTFLKADQTVEGSATLGATEYERQESEDLQELFKNLSLVNQKNSMTLESQQKVE